MNVNQVNRSSNALAPVLRHWPEKALLPDWPGHVSPSSFHVSVTPTCSINVNEGIYPQTFYRIAGFI